MNLFNDDIRTVKRLHALTLQKNLLSIVLIGCYADEDHKDHTSDERTCAISRIVVDLIACLLRLLT